MRRRSFRFKDMYLALVPKITMMERANYLMNHVHPTITSLLAMDEPMEGKLRKKTPIKSGDFLNKNIKNARKC